MILEKEQIQRYLRHILIPQISGAGQKKLLEASMFIYCEDLSSSALMLYYLAAMGIGKIHCQAKILTDIELIKEHLHSLNPYVDLDISPASDKLYSDSMMGFDAAVISCENPQHSLDLRSIDLPVIYTAAAGDCGYLRTALKEEETDIFVDDINKFYRNANKQAGHTLFSLASISLLGTLAAVEAVKVLLGLGKICRSSLKFNLANNSFQYGDDLSAASPYTIDYSIVNKQLREAKILIVGSGGLGSPNAYLLAKMGVGKIGLVDYDVVEISNLNRQILHTTDNLGVPKVKSAEKFLKKLHPEIEICTYQDKFTVENAEMLVKNYDIIIDGLDNLPARYLLNDACYFMKKPMIEAGVLAFNGLASVILPGVGHCYRCIFPESSNQSSIPSCSETGVLGAVPGVMGTLQAVEAVKQLTGIGSTLVNKLVQFDAMYLDFTLVDINRDPDCALCGSKPVIHSLQNYEFECDSKKAAD